MDDARLEEAAAILEPSLGNRLRRGFPLAPLTSFRLGGPAALYVEAHAAADLDAVAEAVRTTDAPVVVIGKGSNILVSDDGFPGIVVRLGRPYRWTARAGDTLTAGGAMPLPALAGVALSHELTGLEFGVAIPASLGGSVWMNAGAHGHALDEVVDRIEIHSLQGGGSRWVDAGDAGFTYRSSSFPPGSVVVAATVGLRVGDPADIRRRMDEARDWRRRTQPLAEPNCGSVFKNPPEDHAARLVEAAGGKELSVGAARVSEKHANFVIAAPGATARDVHQLIALVRERVRERFGVELQPEVHLVGRFDGA